MKNSVPQGLECFTTSLMTENGSSSQTGSNGGRINYLKTVQLQQNTNGGIRNENSKNGFEEWGGYMEAKKAKLDAQINLASSLSPWKNEAVVDTSSAEEKERMFNGISIYVNGYTNPPEPELRQIFVKHGGTIHPYRNSKTSFVIATNLSASSKNLYGSTTVKPEWITDSIAAGMKLNHRDYLLYNLNEENNQRTLTQMMGHQSNNQRQPPKPLTAVAVTAPLSTSEKTHSIELNGSSTTASNSVNGCIEDFDNEILPPSDDETSGSTNQPSVAGRKDNGVGPLNGVPKPGRKMKTATEDGFLEDFFQNSRLHLISDQKKEMQNKIGNLRKAIDTHTFEYLVEFMRNHNQNSNCSNVENLAEPVTLMHVDLDCFFVSVGLLSRPHMRGKPVVVTHSTGKGDNSMSDIASASYEARKFGISNGMWVSEAKKLCPDLEVVPYDFDEYRRVSGTFFDTVAKITLDIEPCSVDEMVIDATSLLQKVPSCSPSDIAEFIRTKVFAATNCTVSVGIGSNKLLAKLATKKAKPNGVYHLKAEDAEYFIQNLEVRDLPGVGWSHESRLQEIFQVKYCKDLMCIPIQNLKKEFGVKTAEKMIQSCKGVDSAELKYGFDRPKSISVDVNYGIRFTKDEQVTEFLLKLAKELSKRAVKAQAKGTNLTLKVMSRKKGAGDPKKHGGHGIVDITTKSNPLFQPSHDWAHFIRVLSKVTRLLTIPASDYRGIGLSLTDLTFDFDTSTNQKKSVQRTLFDLATSRGRQMLESVRKSSTNLKGDPLRLREQAVLSTSAKVNSVNGQSFLPTGTSRSNVSSPEDLSPPHPKRRKIDFSKAVESNTSSNSTGTKNPENGNAEVDLNVLRELPEEIAHEIAQQYGIDLSLLQKPPNINITDDVGISTSTNGKQPSETAGNGNNPYSEIEAIDPSYLCALPEAIRNEVLLQFQEAKGQKKDAAPVTNTNAVLDQPCSSRQALERDNRLKSLPNKKPVQSKESRYVVPVVDEAVDLQSNLRCDEEMFDEAAYKTPPHVSPISRSTTSQGRFRSRRSASITPLSSRRRLDFTEKGTVRKFDNFDLEKFWTDKSYKATFCQSPPKAVALPTLNGAVDVEDVRNVIRLGIATIPDPVPDDTDTTRLHKYFHDLIHRGYLKQGQLLLKFLCRKHEYLPEKSPWRNIIEEIVTTAQEQCIELYEYELDLELEL